MRKKTVLLIGFVITIAYTIGVMVQALQVSRMLYAGARQEEERILREEGVVAYMTPEPVSLVMFPQIVLGVCMWVALLALALGRIIKKIPVIM